MRILAQVATKPACGRCASDSEAVQQQSLGSRSAPRDRTQSHQTNPEGVAQVAKLNAVGVSNLKTGLGEIGDDLAIGQCCFELCEAFRRDERSSDIKIRQPL